MLWERVEVKPGVLVARQVVKICSGRSDLKVRNFVLEWKCAGYTFISELVAAWDVPGAWKVGGLGSASV
jgi:hypothetical protein